MNLAYNQLVNISEKFPPLNNFAEDGLFFAPSQLQLKTYDVNVIPEWPQNLSWIEGSCRDHYNKRKSPFWRVKDRIKAEIHVGLNIKMAPTVFFGKLMPILLSNSIVSKEF